MAESVFDEKAAIPDGEALKAALKSSFAMWEEINGHTTAKYPGAGGEWKFYGKKSGWAYLVKSKKRTLFYLLPGDGCLKLSFTLGEKAVAAAKAAGLPGAIEDSIDGAAKYAEGRSFFCCG